MDSGTENTAFWVFNTINGQMLGLETMRKHMRLIFYFSRLIMVPKKMWKFHTDGPVPLQDLRQRVTASCKKRTRIQRENQEINCLMWANKSSLIYTAAILNILKSTVHNIIKHISTPGDPIKLFKISPKSPPFKGE